MFEKKINSLSELPQTVALFIDTFKNERHFAFRGEMGAGKTTFIKALCQHMGVVDNITSPTFALVNQYETLKYGDILHFDFYRIKDLSEAFDIGLEDYLESGKYCFMEWAERVEEALPDELVEVIIEVIDNNARLIKANFSR
ncbi:MAG: tRNA (adenosine(37)-N6)-threonylcarbamoyltransferase complex ATPase subunit type 1 TsaE [Mangrovibacterium sp.]